MRMSRLLIGLGLIIVLIGSPGRLCLGRLPGDIVIGRENFRFYLFTCDQHHPEHHCQRGFVAADIGSGWRGRSAELGATGRVLLLPTLNTLVVRYVDMRRDP